jgi:formate/nitrite transporter FocA (FNT family)
MQSNPQKRSPANKLIISIAGKTQPGGMWRSHTKVTCSALCKRRFFSFFGNLAGSLFIVWLVDETLLFQTGAVAGVANAIAVAKAKTSASFGTTVVRGLLCNWLVRA